jgi:hypothetical protein
MTADLCSTVPSTPPLPEAPMLPESQETGCKASLQGEVGKNTAAMSAISDAEHVAHIEDCHYLAQLAKARFRGTHSPADAAEAARWEQAKSDAIKARQQAAIERKEADEATFGGNWTREVIERSGAYFDVDPAAVRRRMA